METEVRGFRCVPPPPPGGTRPQPASVPSMLQRCPGRRPAARPQGAAEGPSGHPWDEAQYSLCEDDITPYHGLGVQRRPRSVHDRVPSGAGRVRAGPRARQSRPSHELRIFRRTDIVGGETSRQRGATRRKGKAGRAAAGCRAPAAAPAAVVTGPVWSGQAGCGQSGARCCCM